MIIDNDFEEQIMESHVSFRRLCYVVTEEQNSVQGLTNSALTSHLPVSDSRSDWLVCESPAVCLILSQSISVSYRRVIPSNRPCAGGGGGGGAAVR